MSRAYAEAVAALGPTATVDLQLRSRPELRALPGVLHALGLLPLTQPDVADRVEKALVDNPMLERAPGDPCPDCGRHRTGRRCPSCLGGRRATGEPVVHPFDGLAADAGCEIRSDCRAALPTVLAHLTPRGLLDAEPAEIARRHGIPAGAVAEAVRAIKAVGPPGIAETTVVALLAAQARRLVAAGVAPGLIVDVVRHHLPAVAEDDPAAVPGDPAAVAEAFRLIRTRLRPTAVLDEPGPPPRPADLEVHRTGSGWRVEVPDSRWFGLRLTAVPVGLDERARVWLAPHELAAAELIGQLDARADVLRRVADVAVRRQAGYFDHGPTAHVGLTRTDVAAELGLHPSTVSRAVAGKTLRLPDGRLVPLATLFGGAVAIKFHLAELATRDLTDRQLVAALADTGFDVARRTIAKYRAELGIPAHGRS